MKNIDIGQVYSSDLKRAIDTAQEILKFHPKLKLQLDKRLRERFWGSMQGKVWSSNANLNNSLLGIETNEKVLCRAENFIRNIVYKNQHDVVLIICHSGIKKALLTILYGFSVEKLNEWRKIENTAVSEFKIKDGEIVEVINLNCIKHL